MNELHSMNTVSECNAEAQQATASEGLTKDPYAVAREGFEPTTLRTKGDESTIEPLCPTYCKEVIIKLVVSYVGIRQCFHTCTLCISRQALK